MKRSTERVLTTHTGSLPRPKDLTDMLKRRDAGELVAGIDARVVDAVAEVVRRQADAGLAVVNDGEASKYLYGTYVAERLEGFGDASGLEYAPWTDIEHAAEIEAAHEASIPPELLEFPEFYARYMEGVDFARPACIGPVRYRDLTAVRRDVENLQRALADVDVEEAFITAASPGTIALFLENKHYDTHEAYVWALAEAMKPEYDEIHRAGLLLQLDCPDLASSPTRIPAPPAPPAHIEALNHATRDIPPDRMRMHVCWGNTEGPHTSDVPLSDIIEPVLAARPAGIVFEAANPRHGHEWRVFEDVPLPEGKVLIPGVVDSTSNFVEHPRLVADRILAFATLVGRENVIAGTDCGFATAADYLIVDPKVAWAKLRSLSEGAEIASSELFG